MTINIIEAWHHLLKTHTKGKEVMEIFPFSSHVLTIDNQWEQRATNFEML